MGVLTNYRSSAYAFIDLCEWPHDSNLTINVILQMLLLVKNSVSEYRFKSRIFWYFHSLHLSLSYIYHFLPSFLPQFCFSFNSSQTLRSLIFLGLYMKWHEVSVNSIISIIYSRKIFVMQLNSCFIFFLLKKKMMIAVVMAFTFSSHQFTDCERKCTS